MEHITIEECCDILDSRRIPITASERRNGRYPYYGANGIQDYVADYIFDDELVLLAEDGGNFGSKTRPIAYRVSGKCWVNNHAHVLKPMANVDVDYLCYSLMFYERIGKWCDTPETHTGGYAENAYSTTSNHRTEKNRFRVEQNPVNYFRSPAAAPKAGRACQIPICRTVWGLRS